ncbi:MAG: amidohydrolase family protein [Gemmatimonadetes bacterium]|nr:amidohydrolase family protein [Gemmatimonadota bacterium]
MLDGTVDAGTAAMLAPYAIGDGSGLPRWTAAELNTTVARYDSAGLQVELHAIGDRAIRMALDAFEEAARRNGPRDRRHRVEHLEVPRPERHPALRGAGRHCLDAGDLRHPRQDHAAELRPLAGAGARAARDAVQGA